MGARSGAVCLTVLSLLAVFREPRAMGKGTVGAADGMEGGRKKKREAILPVLRPPVSKPQQYKPPARERV